MQNDIHNLEAEAQYLGAFYTRETSLRVVDMRDHVEFEEVATSEKIDHATFPKGQVDIRLHPSGRPHETRCVLVNGRQVSQGWFFGPESAREHIREFAKAVGLTSLVLLAIDALVPFGGVL